MEDGGLKGGEKGAGEGMSNGGEAWRGHRRLVDEDRDRDRPLLCANCAALWCGDPCRRCRGVFSVPSSMRGQHVSIDAVGRAIPEGYGK